MSYAQVDINIGQKKINGALVEVDKRMIASLKDILAMLKTLAAVPSLAPHLRDVDFGPLDDALNEADNFSRKVAEITPPGCADPPY